MARAWWLLAIPAVVGGLLVLMLMPLGDAGVRRAADRFPAPAEASMTEERVTARRVICLGASPCPSLFRSWSLPRRLSREELEVLARPGGAAITVEGDCVPRPGSFAPTAVCTGSGVVDGYAVKITQLGAARSSEATLTLDVRPQPA